MNFNNIPQFNPGHQLGNPNFQNVSSLQIVSPNVVNQANLAPNFLNAQLQQIYQNQTGSFALPVQSFVDHFRQQPLQYAISSQSQLPNVQQHSTNVTPMSNGSSQVSFRNSSSNVLGLSPFQVFSTGQSMQQQQIFNSQSTRLSLSQNCRNQDMSSNMLNNSSSTLVGDVQVRADRVIPQQFNFSQNGNIPFNHSGQFRTDISSKPPSNSSANSKSSDHEISPWITTPPPNFELIQEFPSKTVSSSKPDNWKDNRSVYRYNNSYNERQSKQESSSNKGNQQDYSTHQKNRFSNSDFNLGDKPWFTEEIKAAIKKKNFLFHKAKSSHQDSASWEEFKAQRSFVGQLIQKAKIAHGDFRDNKSYIQKEKSHSCDTCDRAFVSESELNIHFAEHITCGVTGCTFSAHPKIIALHKKMQHDTGYYKLIKSDEDITKWIEDRKKRFPTADNIKKRKAEEEEKEARGEVIENREFGKMKRGNTNVTNDDAEGEFPNNHRQRFKNRKRSRKSRFNDKPFEVNVISDSDDEDDDKHIKLQKFLGISEAADKQREKMSAEEALQENMLNSSSVVDSNLDQENNDDAGFPETVELQELPIENDNIEKSEEIHQNMDAANDSCNLEDSVLELKDKYAHFEVLDVSSDEGPLEISIQKAPLCKISSEENQSSEISIQQPSSSKISDVPSNRNDKDCVEITAGKDVVDKKKHVKDKSPSKGRGFVKKKCENSYVFPKKSTLLEKLLADDIRKERNLIMQCVRHIVKKDYFGNV